MTQQTWGARARRAARKVGGSATLVPAVLLLAVACVPMSPPTPTPNPVSPTFPVPNLTPAPNVAGDPELGRLLFQTKGCGGCHTLQMVPGATGVAGPNLNNISLRPTLAGETIPNTPQTMVLWLMNPQALEPDTAMPSVGLTEAEAQAITAFLYSQPYNPEE